MDLALCQRALKLNPDLWFAAQLTARLQGKNVFPISNLDKLVESLADRPGGSCKIDGLHLTEEHAKSFFPVRFFPIQDEEHLLISLYAALICGRKLHSLEAEVAFQKKAITSTKTAINFIGVSNAS